MNLSELARETGKSRTTLIKWKSDGVLEEKLKEIREFNEGDVVRKAEQIVVDECVSEAVRKVNEMFGEGTAFRLKDLAPVEKVSSGFEEFDEILGGGFGRGRIVELFGPEGGGKTTLALEICKKFLEEGRVAFLDIEQTLDESLCKSVGLDLDRLDVSVPVFAEEAVETMRAFVKDGGYSLVVLDSIAALTPKAEGMGTSGDSNMGVFPRIMAQAMRLLSGPAQKSKTTLLFLNQTRSNMAMFGPTEITPGGNAIKFFATHRLRIKADPKSKSTDSGRNVEIECVKNKLGQPYKKCELKLIWGKGFRSKLKKDE